MQESLNNVYTVEATPEWKYITNNNNKMACFASKVQQGNKENCWVNNIYDLANKICTGIYFMCWFF